MNTQQFNQEPFNDPSAPASTATFKVLLFNGEEEYIGELDPDVCHIVETDAKQQESVLDLTYPLGEELLERTFTIAIPDMDYGWNVYDIVKKEENIIDGTISIYAENRFVELLTEPIITGSFSSASATLAIQTVLSGTRWSVRNVDITATRTFDLTDYNPLKALRYIESDYGGYLKFAVDVGDFGIQGFYVDFLERLGTETGLEFDLSHNADDIKITTDKSNIVTALYGRGQTQNLDPDEDTEEPLTFESILWDKGAGDPADKPVGQDWVGDETAKALYGKPDGAGGRKHIFGVFNSQSTTDDSLLDNTWEVLQRNNSPKVNVSAKVVDLERVAGFEHEKIRIGDTVRVKVPEFNHYLETEVINIKRDRMAPENTVLEFGDFRDSLPSSFNDIKDKTNSMYNRSAIYGRAGLITKEIVDTEIVYSIDGVLIGDNATFTGTVSAANIIGGEINGTVINTEEKVTIGESLDFTILPRPADIFDVLDLIRNDEQVGIRWLNEYDSCKITALDLGDIFETPLTRIYIKSDQLIISGDCYFEESISISDPEGLDPRNLWIDGSIYIGTDLYVEGDVDIVFGGTQYTITRDASGYLRAL